MSILAIESDLQASSISDGRHNVANLGPPGDHTKLRTKRPNFGFESPTLEQDCRKWMNGTEEPCRMQKMGSPFEACRNGRVRVAIWGLLC